MSLVSSQSLCCFSWMWYPQRRPPMVPLDMEANTIAPVATSSPPSTCSQEVHFASSRNLALEADETLCSEWNALSHIPEALPTQRCSASLSASTEPAFCIDGASFPHELQANVPSDTLFDDKESDSLSPSPNSCMVGSQLFHAAKHTPQEKLLGTWANTAFGTVVTFRIDKAKGFWVESHNGYGELLESGPAYTQRGESWAIWRPKFHDRRVIPDENWLERFAISEEDPDVLLWQLLESWGDWDFDNTKIYRRKPKKTAENPGEVVAVGSADGQLSLITARKMKWTKSLLELKLANSKGVFVYADIQFPINSVMFSSDGEYLFVGTAFGRCESRKLQTSGYVACFETEAGNLKWKWTADELRSPSPLEVGALNVSPSGACVAVSFNQEDSHDCDGITWGGDGCGRPHLVYLYCATGGLKWMHPLCRDSIVSLAHSPHSIYLIAAFHATCAWGRGAGVECMSTSSGHTIWSCEIPGSNTFNYPCTLSFSPCGHFVAWAGAVAEEEWDDEVWRVCCISVSTGKIMFETYPLQEQVGYLLLDLSFSPDGQYIIFSCQLEVEHMKKLFDYTYEQCERKPLSVRMTEEQAAQGFPNTGSLGGNYLWNRRVLLKDKHGVQLQTPNYWHCRICQLEWELPHPGAGECTQCQRVITDGRLAQNNNDDFISSDRFPIEVFLRSSNDKSTRFHPRPDLCHVAVAYLDAKTGELVRKAHMEVSDALGFCRVQYCSDKKSIIAMDAWQGDETAPKLYSFALHGPPVTWRS